MGRKIRRDDTVQIITGKNKGKSGRVLRVDPKKQRVYVEGLNMIKRHTRPHALRDTQRPQDVGEAKQDSNLLSAAGEQLATIAGQQPNIRRARKSIAAFKLREGMPVGLSVTLRGARMYEFLDRFTSVAVPRIRDFRGLNARS